MSILLDLFPTDSGFRIDPLHCDQEPLHIPGAIQPHGAVLAVTADARLVTHVSANLETILGHSPDAALGRPLDEVVGDAVCSMLLEHGYDERYVLGSGYFQPSPGHGTLHIRSYRSGGRICVDIAPTNPAAEQKLHGVAAVQAVLETFKNAKTTNDLMELAVSGLKAITGYDRILAYRFGKCGDGEVVAESHTSKLESYLGLHFPASDRPSPARRLYELQPVGAVADANYQPVPLLVDPALDNEAPVDLKHSALRSVSQIHRQFMQNMNTAASLTIGLMQDQKLWGLLVCHHATTRIASPKLRAAVDQIGQAVSLLLQGLGTAEFLTKRLYRDNALRKLTTQLGSFTPLPEVLAAAETDLLGIVQATGAVLRLSGTIRCLGRTPPTEAAVRALEKLWIVSEGQILAIDDLAIRYPSLSDCACDGSGVLLLPLERAIGDAIMWFRPERRRIVAWGEDPTKGAFGAPLDGNLSRPTCSAAWTEIVRHRSDSWSDTDLTLASELRTELRNAMTRRATARMTSARRESEQWFERTKELAGIGSWDLDVATGRYSCSKELYRILGITPEASDINAQNISTYVHPDDTPMALRRTNEMIAGEEVNAWDMRIIRPDGAVRTVCIEGRPVINPTGVVRRVIGTMQDVTNRRMVERQRLQAQRMDAIGDVTGSLAHDFNNMLAVVTMNLDLLKKHITSNATASELCDEALEGASRCAVVVRRLLAFAQRQPLQPELIDLNIGIRHLSRQLHDTLGKIITLILDLDAAVWPAFVDRRQLEATLVSLATNARAAMPGGGTLRISTNNVHFNETDIALNPGFGVGDYSLIEISDTGVGIPPDNIARIFEPFFTTRGPGQGTGLGLSMAYGFVRQSKGHLSVDSKESVGTSFRIYLPRADPAEHNASMSTSISVTEANEAVLVVEDDDQLRRAAVRQLTSLGYSVRAVADAEAAMVILTNGDPVDLLFTDVVMPGTMDGVDLARMAIQLRPSLKILLTSGFPATKGAEPDEALGKFPLLNKPYTRAQVARAVRGVLNKSGNEA